MSRQQEISQAVGSPWITDEVKRLDNATDHWLHDICQVGQLRVSLIILVPNSQFSTVNFQLRFLIWVT